MSTMFSKNTRTTLIVPALLIIICINVAFIEAQSEEKAKCCADSELLCPCGSKDTFVSHVIEMCYDPKEDKCISCDLEKRKDFCDRFKQCETCLSGLDICHTCSPDAFGPLCNNGTESKKSIYPIQFNVPAGGSSRHRRQVETKGDPSKCALPTTLENADYYCSQWPDRIKCDVHCLYGHALPAGGTKKRIRCLFEEGVWKPYDWADCQPFLDCLLEMQGPGHFFCTYDMQKPNFCTVRCDEFDDNAAVESKEYICDGHFDPELPYCVKVKQDSKLNPPGR